MEKHLTLLAALYTGLGILGVVGLLVVSAVFLLGGTAVQLAAANEPDMPPFLPALIMGLGLFLGLIILVTTIPNFVAAYGLFKRRPWAGIVSLIVGILNLPCFPLGTAVGAYAIWFFLQEDSSGLPGK